MSRPFTFISLQNRKDVDARQPATAQASPGLMPVRRSFSEGGHKAGHDEEA